MKPTLHTIIFLFFALHLVKDVLSSNRSFTLVSTEFTSFSGLLINTKRVALLVATGKLKNQILPFLQTSIAL